MLSLGESLMMFEHRTVQNHKEVSVMPHHNSQKNSEPDAHNTGPVGYVDGSECDNIDPLRRVLCRACSAPVIGQSPFCKDHYEIP